MTWSFNFQTFFQEKLMWPLEHGALFVAYGNGGGVVRKAAKSGHKQDGKIEVQI